MDMEAKLKSKINALNDEARELVSTQELMRSEIGKIETRLTQIVGAMAELDSLMKELDDEDEDEDEE